MYRKFCYFGIENALKSTKNSEANSCVIHYWIKRVHCNRGLSNGPVSSYVKSFNEELHTRPYMVIKRTCHWNKTFGIGSFHTSFHNFHNVLYMYVK